MISDTRPAGSHRKPLDAHPPRHGSTDADRPLHRSIPGHETPAQDGWETHVLGRVLVVEDEADIAALVAYRLTREGLWVETAADGQEALASLDREIPDIIVLDRMIPHVSGDQVLAALRRDEATRQVPVLVLTAKREEDERIEGFELGADDYLAKPFSPRELVLRVQALLRRSGPAGPSGRGRVLRAGPLTLDVEGTVAVLDGEELELTPTEFRLLYTLVEWPGHTQSRSRLLERAWNMDPAVADRIQTRTVDMHVRRLRTKLGTRGEWLETVRGFGYRFRPADGEEEGR